MGSHRYNKLYGIPGNRKKNNGVWSGTHGRSDGTDQQLLGYRHYARELEHDLLLLCPQVENILRNLEGHAPVPTTDPDAELPPLWSLSLIHI